jgi:monovalent cation:H+ antiporter-2, CPA2 family
VAFDFLALAIVTIGAFLGAVVASKLGQSVILGYLVVGIALGELNGAFFEPQAGVNLVQSPTVVALSDLGIAFLLFFVGLEFSVRKLRTAGKPSTILAFVDYGVLLFSGFMVGAAFGWDPVDSLFLGGILAMSSLGIAAKSLIDLKRLDGAHPETEVLLGSMVVENFLSMILLTISVGWVAGRGTPFAVLQSVQGAAIIYGGFLALAIFAMPKLAAVLAKIKNEEVFVLLALTCVFASAGLAVTLGTPFVLGTFFIGMAFSETRLTDRLQLKLSTFRDAFVAVFFVHFGMNISVGLIPGIAPLLIACVAVVLIDEVLILSAFSVMLGFGKRAAVAIGTAACGRSEDAIIYASLGSNLTRTEGTASVPALAHARQFFPLAGGLALVTSAVTPILMRHSEGLALALARITPRSMRFGGRVIGAIFSESIGPRARGHPIGRGDPVLLALCGAYIALLLPLAFSTGPGHVVLAPFVLLLSLLIWREVRMDVEDAVPKVDFARLRFLVHDVATIARYAAQVVLILLLFVDFTAFAFSYSWKLTALAAVLCVLALLGASVRMMHGITRPPARMLATDLLSRAELERRHRARHRRDHRSLAPKDL